MGRTNTKNTFMLTKMALAVSCACLSSTALSQEAESEKIIEVIEVTASKRTQTLQEVPASITAMSGDMLVDRNIEDPRDLSKITPSMITGTGNRNEATINIRGVGYNEVGAPGVAVHVDGVYQPRAGMGIISQIDVERVEVLRGPQSTLYGRNANGGVVNYLTKAPSDEFEGSASLILANFGQTQLKGTVNVPLNDNFAARLTLTHLTRDDGFYENIHPTGEDTGKIDGSTGARLSIKGDLSDNVVFTFIGSTSSFEGNPNNTAVLDQSYNPALASQQIPVGDFKIAHGTGNKLEQDYTSLVGIIDWDINSDWALKSITAHQDYEFDNQADFDFLLSDSVVNNAINDSKTFTQEFNLSGSISNVDTVFGLFYMDDKGDNTTSFTFPAGFVVFPPSPNPAIVTLNPTYDVKSLALFADMSWNLSDDLRLLGGIRFSEDDQTVVQINGPACQNVTTEVDSSSTIGRLGFQYDVSSGSNIFATYSQGVKTGGVNFRSGCQDVFEEEEIDSIELGWKSQSEDRTLTTNITAFYYDYTDLQTQQIIGFSNAIENAPGAKVKGLELDGVWRPDEHWNIFASLSFLDAEYSDDFINTNAAIPPRFVAPPPAPGAPPVTEPTISNVNGNPLNYAPEVSANLSIGYYTDPIIADGNLDFRLDLNYRSEVTLREFNLEGDSNDPVTLVGLSAKWISESEDYTVRLFADNVTNEAFYEFMTASTFNGYRFATWNRPRQYGVDFTVKF